jgi:putative ABC transport system ATP-binding protein
MIRFINVTKSYSIGRSGIITPVRSFSLEISKGETIILSGPSGSGKSTVLNMTAGLIKPSEGTVEIEGKVISKLPEHFASQYRRDHIGMIYQQYNLIEKMTVAENISVPLIPSGMHIKDIRTRVYATLEKLNMADKADIHIEKLSGGEMQRTAIARALINEPSLILADEPTANLDSALTDSLLDIFRMMKDEGRTIIISTHDKYVCESGIADRVITMSKGE